LLEAQITIRLENPDGKEDPEENRTLEAARVDEDGPQRP
jgi:hypothetical protein